MNVSRFNKPQNLSENERLVWMLILKHAFHSFTYLSFFGMNSITLSTMTYYFSLWWFTYSERIFTFRKTISPSVGYSNVTLTHSSFESGTWKERGEGERISSWIREVHVFFESYKSLLLFHQRILFEAVYNGLGWEEKDKSKEGGEIYWMLEK